MLIEADKTQRESGIATWHVILNPSVLAAVQRSPLGEASGHGHMFFNLEQTLAAWQASYPETGG
ncbi:hypothetical protein [Paraburkholderia hospita]|uniref:hypothetical protein n=1 Tax=Paraburkholderia hospita TaxID=169430 RepID=UPI003ECF385B